MELEKEKKKFFNKIECSKSLILSRELSYNRLFKLCAFEDVVRRSGYAQYFDSRYSILGVGNRERYICFTDPEDEKKHRDFIVLGFFQNFCGPEKPREVLMGGEYNGAVHLIRESFDSSGNPYHPASIILPDSRYFGVEDKKDVRTCDLPSQQRELLYYYKNAEEIPDEIVESEKLVQQSGVRLGKILAKVLRNH